MTAINSTNPRASLTTAFRIGLAAGLLIGAAILMAIPARADSSLDGRIVHARVVSEASSALSGCAHRTETLAQDIATGYRAQIETRTVKDYRRVIWFASLLAANSSDAETDQYAELLQMLGVYGEMIDRIVATARAGHLTTAVHEAQLAAGIAEEIQAALQRVERRDFDGLLQLAALKSVDSPATKIARVE